MIGLIFEKKKDAKKLVHPTIYDANLASLM